MPTPQDRTIVPKKTARTTRSDTSKKRSTAPPPPAAAASRADDAAEAAEAAGPSSTDGPASDAPVEVAAEVVEARDEDSEPELEGDEGEGDAGDEPVSSQAVVSMERLDPMSLYLREVQRHPLLTPEQTHDLAVKYIAASKEEDHALAAKYAARLVTANLRLVVKIAYEYRRAYKNIMDLVQEGNIGLMQAVKRYDPHRGVKLSSYSAWWIRAYILRFVLNNWRLVKLGTTQAQRKLFFNLRKKKAELQAMGIDPTDAEVAKQLNVPEADVREMDVRLQQSEKSLDAPVGDADGRSITRVDMMPAAGAGPELLVADEELQNLLKAKLRDFRATLEGKDKEIAIFDERLVADEPLTLQELGDRFKISRERVRQLEQRLMARLRDYLKREMTDVTEVL